MNRSTRCSMVRRTSIVCGLIGFVFGAALRPLEAADLQQATPERIVQQQPEFYVKADVDHANREYREGDKLAISVICEQDAYIYVLYKQSDGKVFQIFPNSGQTDNKVKAKLKVTIPAADDRFRWKVSAPFGKEVVKVIASKEPLTNLDDPELRAKMFNRVSQQQVSDLLATLDEAAPPTWTEDLVEITTHDKSWTPPKPPSKRFGVYFGVGTHRYNDLYNAVTKDSLNRSSSAVDAIVLDHVMKQLGKVDDSRVFVNDQATRGAIEEAITQWLPSVSQPGDTVFIFFGGHGDMLMNRNTGRGRLGYILPHDYVGQFGVVELTNRHKKKTITADETALLKTWYGWIQGARSNDEIDERFARHTGVPDDTFGHWLQRLAGRQVVVLLGSCHSGGFADEGKSLESKKNVSFQYLNEQLERLNGLGQGEVALLAACGSKETSLSYRVPDDQLKALNASLKGAVDDLLEKDVMVSVYSYYILDSLLNDPAPLKIETVFERCRSGTAAYLEKLNVSRRAEGNKPIEPYTPQLFKKNCKQPVLMKPQ